MATDRDLISRSKRNSLPVLIKATRILVAFFIFVAASTSAADLACDSNLNYPQGLERLQKQPSAKAVLEFLDSLLVDDLQGKGFQDLIYNDLGFQDFGYGRLRRWSWLGSRLKIPAISAREFNPQGLSDYALNLAEYLVAVKAARLRWSFRRSAVDPTDFVKQVQPTVERLQRISYQIAGMLHPASLKRSHLVADAFGTITSVIFLSPPPIHLFVSRPKQAFEYFVQGPVGDFTGGLWKLKAGSSWLLSRFYSGVRISLFCLGLYSVGSFAVTYGPILTMGLSLQHAAHSVFTKPVNKIDETRAILQDLNDDLQYYQTELDHETKPDKRKRLEETILGTKKAIELLQKP